MANRIYSPPGYWTKAQAAQRLGMSTKTLERRMKTERLLSRVLRKGRQVWLRTQDVDAYFRLGEERGYI